MEAILSAFSSLAIDWQNVEVFESEDLQILALGKTNYLQAREIQNDLVSKRKNNLIKDTLILTEHPPTLTLGKRLNISAQDFTIWKEHGVEVFQTDRGGELTFHAPGQLILYPVINLRDRKLGVVNFVQCFFTIISEGLSQYGMEAKCKLEPAGLWVKDAKIGSVGLRIEKGVTNHGFSLNLSCSLKPFSLFPVCGQENAKLTSVLEQTGDAKVSVSLINSLGSLFLKFNTVSGRYSKNRK